MPAVFHSFLMTLAIGAAYWWVSVPELNMYSLQAMALVVAIYFLVKRLAKAKLWHVLPTALTVETSLATFAFLLLIGSTGNTNSVLYPLIYVHLFFVVFSSLPLTSIVVTVELMLFHYAVTPQLSTQAFVTLTTLPIIMIFFLFAKRQHEEIIRDRMIISEENDALETLEKEDDQIRNFMNIIGTKIALMHTLLEQPDQNGQIVQAHLSNIELELAKMQSYLRKNWWGWSHDTTQR